MKRQRELPALHAVQALMRCILLVALFACNWAAAADMDALHSADCGQALQRLQAQEEQQRQAGTIDDTTRARWQGLREAAARICLGGDGTLMSPSQHTLRSPIAVAPIGMTARSIAVPAATPAAPALRPSEPPVTVLSCDAAGCLASDGSRLTRAGPGLIGPKGLCTVQGRFLQCP